MNPRREVAVRFADRLLGRQQGYNEQLYSGAVLVMSGDPAPSRYCVTSGDRVDNLGLARTIADAMGQPLRWEPVDGETGRPGHDTHYALDGSRLAALGWVPPVSFGEAVKRTVARGAGE